MRKLVLAALLLATPASGAGYDTEALCDNPPPGVTCRCNELFAIDDGSHSKGINPSGSVTKECRRDSQKSPLSPAASGRGDFVTGASVGLDGAPYVFRGIGTDSHWRFRDDSFDITDKTWCTRYYAMWDPNWECNPNACIDGLCGCNLKGPRFLSGTSEVYGHPGAQSSTPTAGSPINPTYFASSQRFAQTGSTGGFCSSPACKGTGSFGSALIRNQDGGHDITFEDMQRGWSRWEICFDHNPAVPYNTGAPYYGRYDGATDERLFYRYRMTMITGHKTGQQMFYGPGMTNNPMHEVNLGEFAQLWSTNNGSDSNHTRSDVYLSYGIVMTKSPADPSWWPGAAIEIEGPDGVITEPQPDPQPEPQPEPDPEPELGKPGRPYVVEP